jgi:hypothetical protein
MHLHNKCIHFHNHHSSLISHPHHRCKIADNQQKIYDFN